MMELVSTSAVLPGASRLPVEAATLRPEPRNEGQASRPAASGVTSAATLTLPPSTSQVGAISRAMIGQTVEPSRKTTNPVTAPAATPWSEMTLKPYGVNLLPSREADIPAARTGLQGIAPDTGPLRNGAQAISNVAKTPEPGAATRPDVDGDAAPLSAAAGEQRASPDADRADDPERSLAASFMNGADGSPDSTDATRDAASGLAFGASGGPADRQASLLAGLPRNPLPATGQMAEQTADPAAGPDRIDASPFPAYDLTAIPLA